jgi:hypothetical protein
MELIIIEIFAVLLVAGFGVTIVGFAVAMGVLVEELWRSIRDQRK